MTFVQLAGACIYSELRSWGYLKSHHNRERVGAIRRFRSAHLGQEVFGCLGLDKLEFSDDFLDPCVPQMFLRIEISTQPV